MKLKDLKPAMYNPRTISEDAFSGLGKSLERFGILANIVWNRRTGNIVGGHQRYKQLRERGIDETDVIVVDLDDTEEVTLNIALNSPEIQGDFTQGAIAALRMTEARIGQAFQEIKLDGLLSILEKKSKKKEKKPKKDGDVYQEADPIDLQVELTEPIINCPNCGSKWEMNSKKVILDTSSVTEENKDAEDKDSIDN
ncbi:MAG: ParB N-terminal domain-containing protein [Bacteroidales bacterium]|nr:ParB N-terminal domain-containing protein [Bacteroidales bacterium]